MKIYHHGTLPNGHVLGPESILTRPQKQTSTNKNFTLKTGRVMRKVHSDEKESRGKRATEYEIMIDSGVDAGQIVKGALAPDLFGGTENSGGVTYKAKTTGGKKQGKEEHWENTDASRVLFGFIDGDNKNPIILQGIPTERHSGINKGDDVAVDFVFNGTRVQISKDGVLNVSRGDTFIKLDNGGNIQMDTAAKMTINSTGETEVNSSSTVNVSGASGITFTGPFVNLGGSGANQSLVRGDVFASMFNSHTHAGGSGPDQLVTATHLSSKIKVE